MTANRRIFLNIVATYGRSLLSLICGLFTARWVLMALGHSDYGLYSVIGGLTVFISFFNNMLSIAIGRYYAFSIGESEKQIRHGCGDVGLENCQRWFNTALCVHAVVPIMLLIVGYPIGLWMVQDFLTIPCDRVHSCIVVWNYASLSCFVGMISVPFYAMYVAKQYIAELTIYSVAQTLANFVFFYYMACHPGDWLVGYGAWMCAVAIVPQIIICLRAFAIFPECRVNRKYFFDFKRLKLLGCYAFWQMFGGLGSIFRTQTMSILVNKYFGSKINASMAIANTVSNQTQTLSIAMQGAFQPAIVTAFGRGDMETVRQLSYRACKYGILLTYVFMLPVSLEIDEILLLWLKSPPPFSSGLILCMFGMLLIDKATIGHCLACNASGKIAGYQATGGIMLIACLPLAWAFLSCGLNVLSVGYAILITTACNSLSRAYFARKLVGMSFRYWLFKIIFPIVIAGGFSLCVGFVPRLLMEQSFLRVVLTSCFVEVALFFIGWHVVLDLCERQYVWDRLHRMVKMK